MRNKNGYQKQEKNKSISKAVAVSLRDYIKAEYNGNNSQFARQIGVQPAQVTQWLVKEFIVVDDALYSRRRDLLENKKEIKR